ncbi:type I restriction modification DNA specificity domain protein [Capnocytophaga sp. oral taxon 335 str. F0486]|jgi:type I restriction-modification system specificity determinant|uniref:restriction endonuclease subunit S n=1 Tax=Capnocytophaga sp. oral taxon 335 TaxID=712215 RepID=UPI00026F27D5|nr:restriction endonuclease subunit S [Capnocytophaga sp. oral taxon 335]EJF36089.1 type I restriction modification DNA specificity domain protein [Capnocytophaga sp. oral taxon 335 str. F0486]
MKTYKKLKFVELRELGFWDTKRYLNISDKKFKNNITLSDVLIPYKKKISKREMIEKKYAIISKINFGGELFLRDLNDIENYKGDIYLVPDNSIIYSKINVKHGCIFYNDKGNTPFGVSSEYPIFTFDNTIVSGKFLQKLLRTQEFKKLLDTKATGISKARVKQADFLATRVPLPPLSEQETIVKNYYDKITQATTYEQQAETLEKNIETYLFESLGIEQKTEQKTKKKGLQFVEFGNLEKWGIDFILSTENIKHLFTMYKISDLCKISSGGTPSRGRKEYFEGSIPWIKTGELNDTIIYDTEEKITEEAIKNSSAKLYKKDSLVIAMYGATIGKTAKLGIEATTNQACAVLFDINTNLIEIDFLWEYLQSQTKRLKKMAYGSAQPNLNAKIISNYNIPIPPKETQQAIITQIDTYKNEIKILRERATLLKQQAEQEFEQTIFS